MNGRFLKNTIMILLLVCLLPLNIRQTAASEYREHDGLIYEIQYDGTVKIVDCDESAAYVFIPDKIDTMIVTTIGKTSFSDCAKLKSVTIPDTVTTIEGGAFSNCVSLVSINLPENVSFVSGSPFMGCSALRRITVDENNPALIAVDDVLFDRSQTEIISYPGGKSGAYAIPSGVETVSSMAFALCRGLASISVPLSVTVISDYAFFGCEKLTDVYYAGSEEDWNHIDIKERNEPLSGAVIHFGATEYTPSPQATAVPSLTYEIKSLSLIGSSLAEVELSGDFETGGALIICAYDRDGVMTDINRADILNSRKMYLELNTSGASRVSAYVWNNLSGIKPLSEPKHLILE